MKINELLKENNVTISYEVFPPKNNGTYDSVAKATEKIAALKPSFMSVTYGAGGGNRENTLNIATNIQKKYGVDMIAHLTCVGATKDGLNQQLLEMKQQGIENIMALRGDLPEGYDIEHAEYQHASDLVKEIKRVGDFCIGGACYPEGHPESANKVDDICGLKKKVEAGCDFLTTQMFFDNNILYNYLYRIREQGITVPVFAGVMPVTAATQVKRIVTLSGTYVPSRFKAIVDRFGDNRQAMEQAGIAYATEQIIDLIANNVNHIHVYSMNKPEVAQGIHENLSKIIGM